MINKIKSFLGNASKIASTSAGSWRAEIFSLNLEFAFTARTSKGELKARPTYFLILEYNQKETQLIGIGEAGIISGISPDANLDFGSFWNENWLGTQTLLKQLDFNLPCEEKLALSAEFFRSNPVWEKAPALSFALETAILSLSAEAESFQNLFQLNVIEQHLTINGLVWMDSIDAMRRAAYQKLEEGFCCLKFKIGSFNWADELALLTEIRAVNKDLIIRVDANGAYNFEQAKVVLQDLAKLNVHSIEQPLKRGDNDYKKLISHKIIPIALDEELSLATNSEQRKRLLELLQPEYLILKPSIVGGFSHCFDWIRLGKGNSNSDFWLTSALESSLGLFAIAQLASKLEVGSFPQGLGTGKIYTNNLESFTKLSGDQMTFKLKE